jgi:hypothetical protein
LLALRREADIIAHIRQLVPEYCARPGLVSDGVLPSPALGIVHPAPQYDSAAESVGHEPHGSGAPIACEQ